MSHIGYEAHGGEFVNPFLVAGPTHRHGRGECAGGSAYPGTLCDVRYWRSESSITNWEHVVEGHLRGDVRLLEVVETQFGTLTKRSIRSERLGKVSK